MEGCRSGGSRTKLWKSINLEAATVDGANGKGESRAIITITTAIVIAIPVVVAASAAAAAAAEKGSLRR